MNISDNLVDLAISIEQTKPTNSELRLLFAQLASLIVNNKVESEPQPVPKEVATHRKTPHLRRPKSCWCEFPDGTIYTFSSGNQADKRFAGLPGYSKNERKAACIDDAIGPLCARWHYGTPMQPEPVSVIPFTPRPLVTDERIILPILLRNDGRSSREISQDLNNAGYGRSDGNAWNNNGSDIRGTFWNSTTATYGSIIDPICIKYGIPLRRRFKERSHA